MGTANNKMKPKEKTSAIAKAIEDAVFANVNNDGEVSDDNNEETRAKIVEKDEDDDDIDIFTRDFSSEEQKPSKLRILNAEFDQQGRYKGKKVSRKALQSSLDEDDNDLDAIENNSDDSEDEAINQSELKQAELHHMFEMEGVEYEDEDEDDFDKKYQRSQSPDLDYLNDSDDQLSDDKESSSDDENISQKVKELLAQEKPGQKHSSDEDTSENEELEESDEDKKDKEDFMAQIKKISKDQTGSSSHSDTEDDKDDEFDDEDEMGPDLSKMFKNDSIEQMNVEDEQSIATFTAGNVEKEISKGKCIQRQLQIWDNLLELRIAMQKSLIKVNQFPIQMKPFKEASDENELKKSQVMLAKIL